MYTNSVSICRDVISLSVCVKLICTVGISSDKYCPVSVYVAFLIYGGSVSMTGSD